MAVTSFIPEFWSARLLTTLSKSLVFGSVANRDYEGLITDAGDTVHINNITDPVVASYVRNSTTITPSILDTVDQALLIDQAKYFAFYVDDVDARQAAGDLIGVATDRAAYKLSDTADQFLNTTVVAGAGSRTGGLTITTGENVWSQLLAAKVVLDTNNVPTEGRFAVITPAFHALLLDTTKFLDASASGSTEPLLNGRVGRAAGFDIRVSNNASANTIITGHPMGLTYAEQIVKVEAYRPQSSFSDAVKGLHVYGAKVVRPEALVMRRVAAL
jgi:N4-gp56 family major capsid protein